MTRTAKGHGSDPMVSPRLRAALVALVEEGATIEDAAARGGLKPESLKKSLRKPHVAMVRSEMRAMLRDNTRDKAFHKVADLVGAAKSEYVQLDAAKHALALAGEAPSTVAPAAPLGGNGGFSMTVILPAMTPDAQNAAMTFAGSGVAVAVAAHRPAIEPPREAWPGWRPTEDQDPEAVPVPAAETGRGRQ